MLVLLLVWAPPIIEAMAAARAAVKFGSLVIAAVAAPTLSDNEGGCGCCCWLANPAASIFDGKWRPENLVWL